MAARDPRLDAAIALWGSADARSLVAIARAARSGRRSGSTRSRSSTAATRRRRCASTTSALDDFRAAEALFAAIEQRRAARRRVANEALAVRARPRGRGGRVAQRTVQPAELTDLRCARRRRRRRGERETADAEWNFACNEISTGCRKYRDPAWLREIRRWPDVLVDAQADFLARRKV